MVGRPLGLLVTSPDADSIHMALRTGAVSAAMGRAVVFFFAKGALAALMTDGWEQLTDSSGTTAAEMDARQIELGVPDRAVLMEGMAALNVRIYACDESLREQGIDPADLDPKARVEITSLATFFEDCGGVWAKF